MLSGGVAAMTRAAMRQYLLVHAELRHPGHWTRPEPVDYLALAGGLTGNGDDQRVYVLRRDASGMLQRSSFNLSAALSHPESRSCARPSKGTTVRHALDTAGEVTDRGALSRGAISRRRPNGASSFLIAKMRVPVQAMTTSRAAARRHPRALRKLNPVHV
jgi:hypothetical protein